MSCESFSPFVSLPLPYPAVTCSPVPKLPLTPLSKHRGGGDTGGGGAMGAMPPQLVEMLSAVCHSCYGELRSHIIKLNSIELLGDVIHVLREEGFGVAPSAADEDEGAEGDDGLGRGLDARRRRGGGSGGAGERAFAPMSKRLVADAQERLAFRGELYVQASIRNFDPSAFDLAYPRKLEDFARARRLQAHVHAEAAAAAADADLEASRTLPLSQRAVWYPPLVRTLEFLARVYLNVDDSTSFFLISDYLEVLPLHTCHAVPSHVCL